MSIHEQIRGFSYEIAKQIKEKIENDLKKMICEGYLMDSLTLCFYRDEPLHYSVRYENKILIDRWLTFDFKTETHEEE